MKNDANQIIQIQKTSDGSFTLLNTALGETYHSRNGAFTESQYVYIDKGLNGQTDFIQRNVLEVGFGTGMNAWLTAKWAEDQKQLVRYYALEVLPLPLALCPCPVQEPADVQLFERIHQSPWEQAVQCSPFFYIHKRNKSLQDFLNAADFQPNVIFYDAFAPGYQPELWEPEIFHRVFKILMPDGILVTYCAKGDVRRALKAAGFHVERLKGPPGKREMLRARKPSDA